MGRTIALALMLLVCAGCNVRFQRGAGSPSKAAPATPPAAKSEGTGVALAVVGSVVPAIGFGVGMAMDDRDTADDVVLVSVLGGLVLPSLGYVYAGRKTSPGMYPRAAAVATLVFGALTDGLGESEEADKWYGATAALYGLGCAIDIVLTPSAVRDFNARRAPAVTLVPAVVPGGAGLAVGGQF